MLHVAISNDNIPNVKPLSLALKTSTNASLFRNAMRPPANPELEAAPAAGALGAEVEKLTRLVQALTEAQAKSIKIQQSQSDEITSLKQEAQTIKARALEAIEQKILEEHASTQQLVEAAAQDRAKIKASLEAEKAAHEAQVQSIAKLQEEAQTIKVLALKTIEEKISQEHAATQALVKEAAQDRAKIKASLEAEKTTHEAQVQSITKLQQEAQAIKAQALEAVDQKILEEHAATQALVRTLEESTNAKLLVQREESAQQSVENYLFLMNDVQESLLDINQQIYGFDKNSKKSIKNQIDENTLKQAKEIADSREAVKISASLGEEIRAMEQIRDAEHADNFVSNVLPGLDSISSGDYTPVLGSDNEQ